MRPALVTLLPMFAAAVLVMVGGERLARRDVETRTPIDRDRLVDFDEGFRAELSRLDSIYLSHLGRLATNSIEEDPEETATAAEAIAGIRQFRIFRKQGSDSLIPLKLAEPDRLLEIEMEGRKKPFNPNRSVILDAALLEKELPPEGKWISTPDPELRLYCHQPEPSSLVTILVDTRKVNERALSHLEIWVANPITPLREAGERVVVEPTDGTALITTGTNFHGPAASVIPIRTVFNDWQIKAWDGLGVSTTHDSATLMMAATLALALVASGTLLFFQQKRALELASQRVSFVNRVSHELGTPLTNLSLNLDLATETLTSRPADARRRLGIVAEEIDRLARLVANVLTFSRQERDSLKIKPAPCQPNALLERTLDSFRPALERRQIAIETDFHADQSVLLDPDSLTQIVGNLISNVEKYGAEGRWILLRCRLESHTLSVEVHDHGPGIPKAARERIFKSFERVRSRTNEGSSGTGLGLSIGRDLAQRMGGTLELIPSEKGCVFRLELPAPPPLSIVSPSAA